MKMSHLPTPQTEETDPQGSDFRVEPTHSLPPSQTAPCLLSTFSFNPRLQRNIPGCLPMVQVALLTSAFCQAVYFNRGPWDRAEAVSHPTRSFLKSAREAPSMLKGAGENGFCGRHSLLKSQQRGQPCTIKTCFLQCSGSQLLFVHVFTFPGSKQGERIQQGKDNCVVAALCTQSQIACCRQLR